MSLFTGFILGLFVLASSFAQEVSEEAERHMFRGQAAMEEAELATDDSGYRDAVAEFKQAIRLAPNWADAWFNLGVAQEKVGDLPGAMSSFRRYLELNPNAPDRTEVRALIYKLEYLNDKATKEAKNKRDAATRKREARASLVSNLSGEWRKNDEVYQVKVSGNSISILYKGLFYQGKFYPSTAISYRGIINGLNITGNRTRDYKPTFSNGKVFTRSFTGKIDERGDKIYLKFNVVVPMGAVGNVANGWGESSGEAVLTRSK